MPFGGFRPLDDKNCPLELLLLISDLLCNESFRTLLSTNFPVLALRLINFAMAQPPATHQSPTLWRIYALQEHLQSKSQRAGGSAQAKSPSI